MLRYTADIRSIAFLIICLATLYVLWNYGAEMSMGLFILVYSFQILMAITVSVIAHNHQHLNIWKNKWLNIVTDNVITVLYGFPVFAWIPTHNTNHHVHVNKEPDYTRTYRYSEKNNLGTILSYPAVSGYFQQGPVGSYLVNTYKNNKRKFFFHLLQIISLVLYVGAFLILDWRKALGYVVIPQQVALNTVLVFNYLQHVHTDEESEWNNSRNFTGWMMNFILLNNGFHTAHHHTPGVHWSKLKEKHAKVAHKIDDSLNEKNLIWYLVRTYILSIFIPKYRSHSMRVDRLNKKAA